MHEVINDIKKALAPIKPKQIHCWFFHRWGQWETIAKGDIGLFDRRDTIKGIIGRFVDQQRQCQRCRKIELKTEKAYLR